MFHAGRVKPEKFVDYKESPGTSPNLGKSKNSWKTLAWPMFSNVFSWKFMENIGQANVFHEFVAFQRISWDQPHI